MERIADKILLRFDSTMGDFSDSTQSLSLMSYVYPDAAISAEGSVCEEKIVIFIVDVYARRALYNAIHGVTPRNPDESHTIRRYGSSRRTG